MQYKLMLKFSTTQDFNDKIRNQCTQRKDLAAALSAFQDMRNNAIDPDVDTYTYLLFACAENGNHKKAIELLRDMESKGIPPQDITYKLIVSACHVGRSPNDERMIINEMMKMGFCYTYRELFEKAKFDTKGNRERYEYHVDILKSDMNRRGLTEHDIAIGLFEELAEAAKSNPTMIEKAKQWQDEGLFGFPKNTSVISDIPLSTIKSSGKVKKSFEKLINKPR